MEISQDSTDRLIRYLIRTRREATPEEIERIVTRMAAAPFMGAVHVPPRDRGLNYQGRTVGAREESLFYHLAKRVGERQWTEDTTEEQYLQDLRDAIRSPEASLVLYKLRGGNLAATLSPNQKRRGSNSLAYVFVVHSADRGRLATGYQASGFGMINVSENPLWLK